MDSVPNFLDIGEPDMPNDKLEEILETQKTILSRLDYLFKLLIGNKETEELLTKDQRDEIESIVNMFLALEQSYEKLEFQDPNLVKDIDKIDVTFKFFGYNDDLANTRNIYATNYLNATNRKFEFKFKAGAPKGILKQYRSMLSRYNQVKTDTFNVNEIRYIIGKLDE